MSTPSCSKEERERAEKAEFWQSVSALYIPFSLFIATVIFSGGVFLIYYNEPAGWFFIATTGLIAISAFVALIKFQNKYRAKGIVVGEDVQLESTTIDASPENKGQVRIAAPKKAQVETENTTSAVQSDRDKSQVS